MANLPIELVLEIAKYMGIEERLSLAKAFDLPTNPFVGKLRNTSDFEELFAKSRARDQSEFRLILAGPYVVVRHPEKMIVDGIEHTFTYYHDTPGMWLEEYYDNLENVYKYRYFSQHNQTSTQLVQSIDSRTLIVGAQFTSNSF